MPFVWHQLIFILIFRSEKFPIPPTWQMILSIVNKKLL